MLVTLIIIAALLAGGAVLASLQLASNRSTQLTRSGTSALYCAEAGLSAGRLVVAAGYQNWATSLAASSAGATTEPAWIAAGIGSHDLDGDGVADFTIYIRDNGDEGSGVNNPAVDNDLQVFIVATCTKYVDTPKRVEELVLYNGGTTCNPEQLGGQDNNGNKNDGC